MKKGHVEFLTEIIQTYKTGEPILTKNLAKQIAKVFELPADKAKAATDVAIKLIMDRKTIGNLKISTAR